MRKEPATRDEFSSSGLRSWSPAPMKRISPGLCVLVIARVMILAQPQPECRAGNAEPEFIRVGKDGRHFVLSGSGSEFRAWGFNYDHDASDRLLEIYWIEEWNAVWSILSERPPMSWVVDP